MSLTVDLQPLRSKVKEKITAKREFQGLACAKEKTVDILITRGDKDIYKYQLGAPLQKLQKYSRQGHMVDL